jgi:hypothetical protein
MILLFVLPPICGITGVSHCICPSYVFLRYDHSGWIILHSQPTVHSDSSIFTSPPILTFWLFLLFVFHSHANGCELAHFVVLICISLMFNDAECFLYCLVICLSSLENIYSSSLPVLKSSCLVLLKQFFYLFQMLIPYPRRFGNIFSTL